MFVTSQGSAYSQFKRALAGRNLLTFTDYTGADPEGNDGSDQLGNQLSGGEFGRRDYYQLPPQRTFSLSARVTF